jgi:N6-adenosine-specific RNA methylase IME4
MSLHPQPSLFTGPVLSTGGWPFHGLEPQAFDIIMADPAWKFRLYSPRGEKKSPQRHYRTMDTAEIAALPVGLLASNNCLLLLWCTWPMLRDGFAVMEAWGFRYVSGGAWDKGRMGPGYVVRTRCEPFLLGTTGSFDHARGHQNLIAETRRQHSRKPEAAYRWLETYRPGATRLELFSRTPRQGWAAWGDEVGKFNGGES